MRSAGGDVVEPAAHPRRPAGAQQAVAFQRGESRAGADRAEAAQVGADRAEAAQVGDLGAGHSPPGPGPCQDHLLTGFGDLDPPGSVGQHVAGIVG